MQLVQLSNKLKPITLAVGLLSVSSNFVYTDVDSYSGILTEIANSNTAKYLNGVDYNERKLYNIDVFKFRSHLAKWQVKTMLMSSTKAIIEDADFKAIISMGNLAVPYIIEEIESNPSTLVWALNIIFNRKITNNPNTTIPEACKLWVRELKK